ncbi:MAG: hypothetical protein ACRYFR_14090 [Janthinobacterium lividum]
MLIGSLGAASTGKTTAIIGITHQLKINGVACEYLPEAARVVIDKLGYADQKLIAKLEKDNIERAKAHPDRLWLSDSGLFLGQFYGGPVHDTDDYDMVIHFERVYKSGYDSGRVTSREHAHAMAKTMALWAKNQQNVVDIQDFKISMLMPCPARDYGRNQPF